VKVQHSCKNSSPGWCLRRGLRSTSTKPCSIWRGGDSAVRARKGWPGGASRTTNKTVMVANAVKTTAAPNALRQPMACEAQASGVVAARLPSSPIDKIMAVRVEKRSGGSAIVQYRADGTNFCLYRKPIQTLSIGSSLSLANFEPPDVYGHQLIFVYHRTIMSFPGEGGLMKRVAIYLRVSTSKQDTDNQRRELEAVAERSGWKVVKVYQDAGISGAKGRDKRPGLDAMMKAVNAKEFDMVASWSVDRLGRSLTDLLSILQGLHDKGVGLFLHQQGLDTSTTAGKAMFQMLGVFAEFERGIIRERVNAGLARARANGVKLGRRRVKASVEAQIVALRDKGYGILKIGKKLRIGTSVVQRVFKEVPWR
jgi:DNA invertase Pin-like site-specific DNA recombinase